MAAAVEQLWGDFPDLGAALAGDWALVQRGAGGGRIDADGAQVPTPVRWRTPQGYLRSAGRLRQ